MDGCHQQVRPAFCDDIIQDFSTTEPPVQFIAQPVYFNDNFWIQCGRLLGLQYDPSPLSIPLFPWVPYVLFIMHCILWPVFYSCSAAMIFRLQIKIFQKHIFFIRLIFVEPPPNLPFHIRRSRTNNLPVYSDIRGGGNQHLTIIRKIRGDLKVRFQDFRITVKPDLFF